MATNTGAKVFTEVQELRRRAQEHLEHGAVTSAYRADRQTVLRVLNEALATELVCVLRYRQHSFMAEGMNAPAVAEEFLAHSNEELGHADQLAHRITQLNGTPDLNPESLAERSHAEYVEGARLADMVRANLVAERVAIESYAELIRYLEDHDPTTRRLLEGILAVEEEHAEDMAGLLATHAGGTSA